MASRPRTASLDPTVLRYANPLNEKSVIRKLNGLASISAGHFSDNAVIRPLRSGHNANRQNTWRLWRRKVTLRFADFTNS